MINKDRVFIISGNVDDSIKSSAIYVDVKIFKTFKEFEDYSNVTPIDVSNIIVNSKELVFTNNSMNRLVAILNSTFVTITGLVYYMVDDLNIKSKVEDICKKNGYDKIKCVYSETLHSKDVANVLSGDSLSSKDTVVEIKTYRIRAADYIKSQNDKEGIQYEDSFITDEDELANIEDVPTPVDLTSTPIVSITKHVVCSNYTRERSAWVLLKAQYLSMFGKVLIVERDSEYHTLLDMVSKIDIDYDYFDVRDFYKDCHGFINMISQSRHKLIVVGSKHRMTYDYHYVTSILTANLRDTVENYIYEAELSELPYGSVVDVILPTTIPEILRSVGSLSTVSDFKDVKFIGLNITSLGSVNITDSEMRGLLQSLFRINDVNSTVVSVQGLLLRKEIGLGGVFMRDNFNFAR